VRRGSGEECLDQSECRTGLVCDLRGQQRGLCVPFVGEGEKCDLAPCSPGLACHPDTSTCVRRGKEGEACAGTNNPLSATCQQGLHCVEGTCQVWFPGLCRAP